EVEAGTLVARLGGYRAVQWVDPALQLRWSVPEVGQDAAVPRELALGATQAGVRAASRASAAAGFSPALALADGTHAVLIWTPIGARGWFRGWIVGVVGVERLLAISLARLPLPGRDVS